MLKTVTKEIPELYNFAHAPYNGVSVLQFSEFTILSDEGPQKKVTN